MQSIQEVFADPRFATAMTAVVQKLEPTEHNLVAMGQDYTESWPAVAGQPDLIVLSMLTDHPQVRTIHAGFLMSVEAAPAHKGLFRIYADNFVEVGTHDLRLVGDSAFYGKGRGGGSRKLVVKGDATLPPDAPGVPPGMNERRLGWVRKNHQHFRDPVHRHWNGQCAVHGHECGGLLIASHIVPWRLSSGEEKTDRHNGLLLSAPLDTLFDRGWISFDTNGAMLVASKLDAVTRRVFGVKRGMQLRVAGLTPRMRKYLARHRELFSFH